VTFHWFTIGQPYQVIGTMELTRLNIKRVRVYEEMNYVSAIRYTKENKEKQTKNK
jgi:hypothetical protein